MFKRKSILVIAGMFCFLLIFQIIASENLEISNFSNIEKKIAEVGAKYGSKNVLVAFDIDLTLLTTADNFGGDAWFDWQNALQKNNPASPDLVTKNFEKLLLYQVVIQHFVKVYPTEKNIPKILKSLQKKGFKTIALTARGANMRNLAEAQLKSAGFSFKKDCFSKGFPGEYLPYDSNAPQKYGLTNEDIADYKLQSPREVSFFNGIMMVSGQNKGIMLKTLLSKTGKTFKAIVFIDDGKKNTDNVYNVFKADNNVDVVSIRYSYDDAIKRQFEESNKNSEIRRWNELKTTIKNIFGK